MIQAYIARQPIFDGDMNVVFYELLHRSRSRDETARIVNPEVATSELLVNSLVEIGLERIAGDRLAFVNLTSEYLMGDWALPLDPAHVGLELVGDYGEEAAGLAKVLARLTAQGFSVALDDFIYEPRLDALLEQATIVKLDALALGEEGVRDQLSLIRRFAVKVLVKNVEERPLFERLRDLGCDYFQGYFAARPETISAHSLKADSFSVLQLLGEVQSPDISLDRLEEIVSQDVALSYRLLKYINSAFFNLNREISSVRQALIYIGLKPLRTWVSLLVVLDSGDRPPALKQQALARARFCQQLAEQLGEEDGAPFFAVGLFSTLDMLLGMQMDQVLENLPLDAELQGALLRYEGRAGDLLRCAVDHERGEWSACERLGLSPARVNAAYCDALEWVDELMSMMR